MVRKERLTSLPKRILLKPHLERCIEHRYEGDRFLSRSLTDRQEISNIGAGEDLSLGCRIFAEEALEECFGFFKLDETL